MPIAILSIPKPILFFQSLTQHSVRIFWDNFNFSVSFIFCRFSCPDSEEAKWERKIGLSSVLFRLSSLWLGYVSLRLKIKRDVQLTAYIYTYIYIERERERERDSDTISHLLTSLLSRPTLYSEYTPEVVTEKRWLWAANGILRQSIAQISLYATLSPCSPVSALEK